MSQHFATLSLGGYIALGIVPVVLLAGWLIAIYQSDRHPAWRHGVQQRTPVTGPGGAGLSGTGPGPLQVPAEPVSGPDDQPGRPERR